MSTTETQCRGACPPVPESLVRLRYFFGKRLGVADFRIDDYPAIVAWASCPQKGVLGLPLTYAPVSFRREYIEVVAERGCHTYVHHPILEARHWGIIDGRDVDTPVYHRTHSAYAVASFHEALRILLARGVARQADDYAVCEQALRQAVEALGCEVTSNMTSLVVLNLPGALAGREKELVGNCRARDFCIGEAAITRDDLYIADEVFLTGTAAEVTPIREIDNRQIGEGKRGPVTKALQDAFFDVVAGRDRKHEHWLTYV